MKCAIGVKIGMTSYFYPDGICIPVTLIYIKDNKVISIKKNNNNCYIKIALLNNKYCIFLKKNKKKINKSIIGYLNKNNLNNCYGLWVIKNKLYNNNYFELNVGDIFNVNIFKENEYIDATGFSKGKGFSGTIKRWNFKLQDKSHGNSLSHRSPGSIGQNQSPGRVFKGKKMSGRLGFEKTTIQNLLIVNIDIDNNVLFVKGSIPGRNGSCLIIKSAIKKIK